MAINSAVTDLATTAWLAYGKGRHPAALNFSDCFSYACAKARGERLLFNGGAVSQTDIARQRQSNGRPNSLGLGEPQSSYR